ncbi:O-antigen ligase family protein [Candidatus Gottesmanbacteria bacterium]|nr:O-antigen ligase family protein [Candidatus Gottesmanbacteria bacterium]
MNIEAWCNRVIRWGFFLLFILVPLILTPWNYELFEYNKMMVTYGLTAIIMAAWLVKMIAQKQIRIAKTPLDIPLALFLSSQLLSSLFSMDPHVSWFGYYSRFNGGMFSVISYVLLYYAFVSNWTNLSNLTNVLKVSLAAAAVVALYAVLERLGIDRHLWVQDVQNRVFSSLGQPNWLAAYLVALIPLAAGFGLQIQSSKFKIQNFGFWIWNFIAALFFAVLHFTRSRSGLLGFAVADVVFWGLAFLLRFNLFEAAKKVKPFEAKFRLPFIIYHLAFVIIVFFNGTYIPQVDRYFSLQGWKERLTTSQPAPAATPSAASTAYHAPLLETGGTESSTIRKYVWQAAINAWKSSAKTFLVGTGTETFAFAFYQSKPVGHNLTSEWDFLYNKAHNEYLNYLATTGVFGLGSYLLFIGAFVWWFIKMLNAKCQMINKQALVIALFAGWVSILVTNFFGFSVVIVQLFLFLFPAMAIVSHQPSAISLETRDKSHQPWKTLPLKLAHQASKWISLTILLVLLVLLVLLSRAWWADVQYAQSYRLARAGQYTAAQPAIVRAVQLNPGEPLYHDEAATTFAALATLAAENKQATLAATLAKQALEQSDRAITVSPKNVNFWKSRTKVFYTFTAFDQQFNPAAVAALERALELSPNDPKILYNLAILYGRQNDNARAVRLLTTTIAIKPNYRDAYFALHIFYKEMRNGQKAREILEQYLEKVDPNDKDFQARLN